MTEWKLDADSSFTEHVVQNIPHLHGTCGDLLVVLVSHWQLGLVHSLIESIAVMFDVRIERRMPEKLLNLDE